MPLFLRCLLRQVRELCLDEAQAAIEVAVECFVGGFAAAGLVEEAAA